MNRYLKLLQDPHLAQINMTTIVIAKYTRPRHYKTKNGQSKKGIFTDCGRTSHCYEF